MGEHTHFCMFLSETQGSSVLALICWEYKEGELKGTPPRIEFSSCGLRIRRVFLDVLRNWMQKKKHGIVEFPSLASQEANRGQRGRQQLGKPSWHILGCLGNALSDEWSVQHANMPGSKCLDLEHSGTCFGGSSACCLGDPEGCQSKGNFRKSFCTNY